MLFWKLEGHEVKEREDARYLPTFSLQLSLLCLKDSSLGSYSGNPVFFLLKLTLSDKGDHNRHLSEPHLPEMGFSCD